MRPGNRDQVGDALDALAQDVVGLLEGVEHRRAALDDREQPLVGDHDQRVDVLAQALDAVVGLAAALGALELERPRDDADGQRADLVLGDLGDDRRRAGAGAAALARGDEDHVGALERLLDLVARLGRGRKADVRVGARAEALRRLVADVELDVGVAHRSAWASVLAAMNSTPRSPASTIAVDGVRAAAADADDLDHREVASAALHVSPVRRSSSD